jgi:hypothetical protein
MADKRSRRVGVSDDNVAERCSVALEEPLGAHLIAPFNVSRASDAKFSRGRGHEARLIPRRLSFGPRSLKPYAGTKLGGRAGRLV